MLLLLSILLPIAASAVILCAKGWDRQTVQKASLITVGATACLAVIAALTAREGGYTFFAVTEKLPFRLAADGLSKLFACMIAPLWFLTTLYACEYMEHEDGERKFFAFFVMSFGVALGIAFAGNIFTLYLFYEYLTFSTLPLVAHSMDGRARYAGKRYLIYMMSGGALAFIALVVMLIYGVSLDFTPGGALDMAKVAGHETGLRIAFVLAFFGFGVKAAVFPLHGWLPRASVAPTPVTALLHAVAVVKAGVFGIARITYFCFGTALLAGTFAQNIMMAAAVFTIVFGSFMALRTPHLKRRLAYSTVSNLSYIVFALSLMTEGGLTYGMLHMALHAVIKITLFFCAGAILVKTGTEYVSDLKGFGRRMPVTMACFVVSALGLIGVPPLAAFRSKWGIAETALSLGSPLALAGVVALVISEFLTAMYLFQPIVNAYFAPNEGAKCDPTRRMTAPMALLSALSVALALGASGLISLIGGLV